MIKTDAIYDVIGLGVSTVDLLQIVDEFPGQELVQKACQSTLQGGGPVATAIVTLARLGSRTAMIDTLGDDWRADLILEEYRREGVPTNHIKIEPDATSSIASILVRRRDGARTITFSPGSSRELETANLPIKAIAAAKILHLNGRHWNACLEAARVAQQNNVKVSFDGGAHRYRPELQELFPLLDICIVARQFAQQFAGVDSTTKAALRLLNAGPELVVITEGTNGCWVFAKNDRDFHQPAFRIKDVLDTTGAGDVFHGAFLHGIIANLDLNKTAQFASAAAAMSTRYLGGRAGIPSYHEVEAFIVQAGDV